MKLKNVIPRDRDYVETLMDQIKDIAVSGDLLFITVLWRRFLLDQLPDARIGRNDPFNCVGGLSALHLCDFGQLL